MNPATKGHEFLIRNHECLNLGVVQNSLQEPTPSGNGLFKIIIVHFIQESTAGRGVTLRYKEPSGWGKNMAYGSSEAGQILCGTPHPTY